MFRNCLIVWVPGTDTIQIILNRLRTWYPHNLGQKLDELSGELQVFTSLDDAMQTFEGKHFAEKMALIYESVVAVEWAAKYGGKYEKLAEVYLEDSWKLRKIGDSMKTVEYYNEIV
ncbi:hypothetical protein [Ureibacillus acetophenoni]|uniref:Uncharacterized protein n=1 Tax=Ureibacillus acetophenoni TaxID=614649 RepID=A0A285TYL9_9BACL|nr:hypothetical protein [Ureibacillus acetophenoni]SOC34689.1 hypothetical protein SAMN05877842_10125 [Ureibacillus acetophenoni]